MVIDPAATSHADFHRFLIGVVIPRPIAWVSTVGASGHRNLSPFSFFNAIASRPPLLSVSINDRSGQPKDTLRNISETRDFVVNIVDEALHAKMVETSGDWAPEVDEFTLTGLTPLPSERVRSPRVGEAPVSMECALERIVELDGNNLVVGRIVWAHARDDLFTDGRVDPLKLRPVGRLGGDAYSIVRDVVHMARPRASTGTLTARFAAMGETRSIPVREPDVWTFTQRNVPLWDILDFFPRDAVGPRGPKDPPPDYEVKPVTIETDLGWSFESDIQYGSWIFRPRSPARPGMMKWCRERGIEAGDALVFEKVDERRFRLRLEKKAASS